MEKLEFIEAIRERYLKNESIPESQRVETYSVLYHTGMKMLEYFTEYERPCISVSGGSDSDCVVHFICEYFRQFVPKCRFVFVNTGLEYAATKRHLSEIEERYGITIDRIRGISVVTACRKYGFPILNKSRSMDIHYYLMGKEWARYRIEEKEPPYGYSENMRAMIAEIKSRGIKISERCCYYSKKMPLMRYMKEARADLNVTGERKAEGGQRAQAHKSCFEIHKKGDAKFMPVWWWTNEDKATFKAVEHIRYSDCYEVYGMKRTGCCGCPFNLRISEDLKVMRKYEPLLYKAAIAVFGQSYILMDSYNVRKRKCLPDVKG